MSKEQRTLVRDDGPRSGRYGQFSQEFYDEFHACESTDVAPMPKLDLPGAVYIGNVMGRRSMTGAEGSVVHVRVSKSGFMDYHIRKVFPDQDLRTTLEYSAITKRGAIRLARSKLVDSIGDMEAMGLKVRIPEWETKLQREKNRR